MGKLTMTRRSFAQLTAVAGAAAAVGAGVGPVAALADSGSKAVGNQGIKKCVRAAAAAERSNAVCGCTSKMAKWFEPKVTKPASTLWAIIAARGKRPFRLHIILIVSSSQ